MAEKTIFPLRIAPELKADLESLIAEKRSKLALSPRECNLTTETNRAIQEFLKSERVRLATVNPPTRII